MRPSESLHWYKRDGTPAYTIIGANGKERDTNLRDARKLLLVPSVSAIIRQANSDGLNYWKQEQVLMAALTLPRRPHESEREWLQRIWEDSREQARKASELGTAIHAAVQAHYEGEPSSEQFAEHVEGAVDTIREAYPGVRWHAEKSFSHPLGYGGKTDLVGEHGDGIVIDIKTKPFDQDKPPSVYDEHAMQLAAYRRGLGLPSARCANLFVSVDNPGLAVLVHHSEDELVRGLSMFDGLLDYWMAKSKYDSSFL